MKPCDKCDSEKEHTEHPSPRGAQARLQAGVVPSLTPSQQLTLKCKRRLQSLRNEALLKIVFPDFTQDENEYARILSLKRCGTAAIIGDHPDRTTKMTVPIRCKAWDCAHCGPIKTSAWIKKLISGDPTREMTLTIPAKETYTPQQTAIFMKHQFRKLVARIRFVYGTFEYALVWELTKKQTPHMHILFRGSYIPQRWLSATWKRLGVGYIVDIRNLKSVPARAFHATKYLGKQTGQTAAMLAPLRIVQISKGYLPVEKTPNEQDEYQDWTWYHSNKSCDKLLAEAQANPRFIGFKSLPGGGYLIEMKPLDPDLEQTLDPMFVPKKPFAVN